MAVLKHKDNKICADCAERRPTWGAMIKPPPLLTLVGDGGEEEEVMGNKLLCAFTCFQCAGSHRQLGSKVSNVKSVTQEECKCDLKHIQWRHPGIAGVVRWSTQQACKRPRGQCSRTRMLLSLIFFGAFFVSQKTQTYSRFCFCFCDDFPVRSDNSCTNLSNSSNQSTIRPLFMFFNGLLRVCVYVRVYNICECREFLPQWQNIQCCLHHDTSCRELR